MSRLTVTVLVTLLAGCGASNPVHTLRIGDASVRAEIVSAPETRGRGLMHRDALGHDEGMLFIYPDEEIRSFWMKDTRIPLSIAFADKTGKIVRIADMNPFSMDSTSSLHPATYALEVNQGWFKEKGIEKGAMLLDIPQVDVQ